jgi:ABC-2 type transport system permease protein
MRTILRLTVKELRAIARDVVMLVLTAYVFTVATYMVSDAISTDVDHLAIAVVDEDRSPLSQRLTDAIQPPMFRPPVQLSPNEAGQALSDGRYILIASFPPRMEEDIRQGKQAVIALDIDATAVAQAGNGAAFLQQLLAEEVSRYFDAATTAPVDVVTISRFNPNLTSKWFMSVMQLMNSITILTLILSGASLIREREHGTIEHVLVMPVRPHQIVLSKILANGAVILTAAVVSLHLVVQWALGVPVAGSLLLFVAGTAIYVVAVASIGLMLSTFCQSMGQFGLLVIPVMIVMMLLSGGMTPVESQPALLRGAMALVCPSPHFVKFAQSVLYRGSGLALVWDQMLAMAVMAAATFAITLMRFRKVLSG